MMITIFSILARCFTRFTKPENSKTKPGIPTGQIGILGIVGDGAMGLLKKWNLRNLIWDGPDLRCNNAIDKAACIRPVPISKHTFTFSTAPQSRILSEQPPQSVLVIRGPVGEFLCSGRMKLGGGAVPVFFRGG
jgi:hypothetical protein